MKSSLKNKTSQQIDDVTTFKEFDEYCWSILRKHHVKVIHVGTPHFTAIKLISHIEGLEYLKKFNYNSAIPMATITREVFIEKFEEFIVQDIKGKILFVYEPTEKGILDRNFMGTKINDELVDHKLGHIRMARRDDIKDINQIILNRINLAYK
jgi:hypothetical protein